MDASLNEKRILEEKNNLISTEKELYEVEEKSILSLNNSKENLKKLQIQLDDLINEIEKLYRTRIRNYLKMYFQD